MMITVYPFFPLPPRLVMCMRLSVVDSVMASPSSSFMAMAPRAVLPDGLAAPRRKDAGVAKENLPHVVGVSDG